MTDRHRSQTGITALAQDVEGTERTPVQRTSGTRNRAPSVDPVLSRRNVREYTDQPVAESMVRTLLEAAMAAPSANDERPWRFIVVHDQQTKERIPDVHPFAHMAAHAPVVILVCGDIRHQRYPGFWVQDCAAATENMLIEAQQLGLGAVWLGVYPIEGRVQGLRRLLAIPDYVEPFSLVFAGYPAKDGPPASCYDESKVHRDIWSVNQ